MGRTPIFRRLRRVLDLAQGANASPLPTREYIERSLSERALTRRRFLSASAAVAASAGLPLNACTAKHPQASGGPRVAIIGAGIAGLTAAYRLAHGGLHARVFDSWNRVGGRMFTARNMGPERQLSELGGELIDTGHTALRSLSEELGLKLDAIIETPGNGIRQDTWFFGGRIVTDSELVEAFRPVAVRMALDVAQQKDRAQFARLDELGLAAYLDSIPELSALLRQLIDVAYVAEFGREIAEQSPWNLLWLIDSTQPDPFRIYGASDEAYHVHGGNDQITTRLAESLSRPVELAHALVSVRDQADGSFRLAFARGVQSAHEADFDHVIFALPFTRLRQVELQPTLPPSKREMIAQLGMGTNSKLMGTFSERVWRTEHAASGSATTDNGLQLLWETTRGQSGAAGILTVFAGGRIGVQIGEDTPESQMRARLAQLDQIFPGTAASYVGGSALRMHWPSVEHTLGSYTCYLPGQASYSGRVGERVGNLHFCGEHTSEDYQGYMNGGVESGERVATEVLAGLGVGLREGRAARQGRALG
jgi:monoamine oxidase